MGWLTLTAGLDILGVPNAGKVPAIKWRQQNLDKVTKNKRAELVAGLETVLGKDVTPTQLTLMPETLASRRKRRRDTPATKAKPSKQAPSKRARAKRR